MAQTVKNPPTMLETWVRSLDCEDPLKKGTATQENSMAWRIPWTEDPGGLQSTGSQRVRHNLANKHSTHVAQAQGSVCLHWRDWNNARTAAA